MYVYHVCSFPRFTRVNAHLVRSAAVTYICGWRTRTVCRTLRLDCETTTWSTVNATTGERKYSVIRLMMFRNRLPGTSEGQLRRALKAKTLRIA